MSEGPGQFSEDMREVLATDRGIFEQHGMWLESAGDGRAAIHARAAAGMVNTQGVVHGGLAFTMADAACAYALHSVGTPGVTQNANISYLSGAKAEMELKASARIVKRGRRIASLHAEVRSGDALVAHGLFNFVLAEV